MRFIIDFHFHSSFSDGDGSPARIVEHYQECEGNITHLALTDHNTFDGSAMFIDACKAEGIQGFIAAEVSGSHPQRDVEFHFLTFFGTCWNPTVAQHTNCFTPYFNELIRVDTENIFLYLKALSLLGIHINFRAVTGEHVLRMCSQSDTLASSGNVGFGDLRRLIEKLNIQRDAAGLSVIPQEQVVWKDSGITPLPTPYICDAYSTFKATRPGVILAHPHKYGLTPEQLRPFLAEWKEEIGLIGIEAHYGGELIPEFAQLANNMGLLISVGSDNHSFIEQGFPQPVQENELALAPLIEKLMREY